MSFISKIHSRISMSVVLTIVSIVAAANSANALDAFYVFSVNGGMSLNTANDFSTVDGQPRMSIWKTDNNSPYQQFTIFSERAGRKQFQHKATGKCLNAAYLRNGGPVNVWRCDPNDPDQKFVIQALNRSGSEYLIQRAGTNFCIDAPTRLSRGTVHLITCDPNNLNQRWHDNWYYGPSKPGSLPR